MSNSIRNSLYKTFQDNSQLQPSLRVDSGAAALSLPTGCTPEGIVVGQRSPPPLCPAVANWT